MLYLVALADVSFTVESRAPTKMETYVQNYITFYKKDRHKEERSYRLICGVVTPKVIRTKRTLKTALIRKLFDFCYGYAK